MGKKQRADGRYVTAMYLGNGKYKYIYAKTQKELRKKVADAKVALGKGVDISASNDTFGVWAERWLAFKAYSISTGRFDAYKYGLKHLEDFYNRPLIKISSYDMQMQFIRLSKAGLAEATLKNARSAAKQVFDLAIANRVTEFNPLLNVRIPKSEAETARRALTPEEIQWIRAETNHRGKIAAMIMLFAGLRRGEMIALTWDCVNLPEHTITVKQTVEIINGRSVLKQGGKTKSAERTIDIPDVLVDFLLTLPHKSEYVCPSVRGTLMSEIAWKRMWESYMSELNFKFGDFGGKRPTSRFAPGGVPFVIPHFTSHWLRHTYITMLYQAGVDVLTAKEQAGHADISTTLAIYTHLDRTYKRKQIDKLNAYISDKNCDPSNG